MAERTLHRKRSGCKRSVLWKRIKPYAYLAPALLPLLLFVFYPLVASFHISFLEWNMVSPNPKWVGLDNYRELLFDSREFRVATWNTLKYALWMVLFLVVLPCLAAFAVTRVAGRAQTFYKSALFVPTVLSLAVASLIFLWLYNPIIGVLNGLLKVLGFSPVNWLNDPDWALFSMALIVAWKTFGYHFIILLAGMLAVPGEIIESTRVEGLRSHWGLLRRFFLPLTGGTLLFVFMMAIVNGIQYAFVPVQMLTNGGPDQQTNHLVFLTYQYGFQFFRSGLASATAVLTFLFFLVLVIIQARLIDRRIYYEN